MVLGDPGYLERITEMSELMGLQRHSPLEDAVWVMEYVAKTKGAGTYTVWGGNLLRRFCKMFPES